MTAHAAAAPVEAAGVRDLWSLDRRVTFLNHGSFGACPIPVLEAQQAWRDAPGGGAGATSSAASWRATSTACAPRSARSWALTPDDLAFVANATTGVDTVLRSLRFRPGDEILVTDHEYNAALNAVRFVAERDGATVVVAHDPVPHRRRRRRSWPRSWPRSRRGRGWR